MPARRRLKVGTSTALASGLVPDEVVARATQVALKKPQPPPASGRARVLPREKVIAALKRLKSHPMD